MMSKILSCCFLRAYKSQIGQFGHNSKKLSEVLHYSNKIVDERD
jgi:hypothetical protein